MWRATVFYFHTAGRRDTHMIPTKTPWKRERVGSRWQSSGLPNVYSTVLENNFGKWPNGVDITTQMSHVSVKRIGKQAHSPWRRNGNVNTSSSVKWVVSVYDPEGVVEGICVGSMLVWGGSVYAMCLPFKWDTTLATLISLSGLTYIYNVTDVYKWATPRSFRESYLCNCTKIE